MPSLSGETSTIVADAMIRAILTAAGLSSATSAAPIRADTVRGALCGLTRLNPPLPVMDFSCDFTQLQGNVYISGGRRKFAFPAAEQDWFLFVEGF